MFTILLFLILVITSCTFGIDQNAPNVILIMMDDLGFSDIGYNGGIYPTSTLNTLAANGIKLNYHYAYPICSASRTSLLTGRYSYRSGVPDLIYQQTTQHATLMHPFISNILKDANYNTALYGKYHLGYSSLQYLPFNRGFDRTLFYESGSSTYRSHTNCETWSLLTHALNTDINSEIMNELQETFEDGFCSYDLWDENYNKVESDTYSEQLFTDNIVQYINEYEDDAPFFIYYPMQTPHWPLEETPKTYAECDTVAVGDRKLFCNALLYGDEMINNIILSLKANDIFDDTLIIFLSDNGPNPNWDSDLNLPLGYGQTLPLRGTKGSVFEGGIRTPAFIYGGYIDTHCTNTGSEYNDMVHITDWYSMIKHIARIDTDTVTDDDDDDDDDVDGINQWPRICNGDGVQRDEILHLEMFDVNDVDEGYKASYIRTKEWKLMINAAITFVEFPTAQYWVKYDNSFTTEPPQDVYNDMMDHGLHHLYESKCYDDEHTDERSFQYDEIMLFKILEDKIEACNVAQQYPEIVKELKSILFSAHNIDEYSKYNSEKIELSKAGVLAQIESYDCTEHKTYHISWEEIVKYSVQNIALSWDEIFQRYIDIVNECKDELESTSWIVPSNNNMLPLAVYVIYAVSIILFLRVYYAKQQAEKQNGNDAVSTDLTPLLLNDV